MRPREEPEGWRKCERCRQYLPDYEVHLPVPAFMQAAGLLCIVYTDLNVP